MTVEKEQCRLPRIWQLKRRPSNTSSSVSTRSETTYARTARCCKNC